MVKCRLHSLKRDERARVANSGSPVEMKTPEIIYKKIILEDSRLKFYGIVTEAIKATNVLTFF